MTPRTRVLTLGGLAVIILYFGDLGYRSWIEEPSRDLQGQLDRIAVQMREADDAQAAGMKASKPLQAYGARSLPYDPELARSLYQDWLLRLVEQHRLESASIDAGVPIRLELKSRTVQKKRRLAGYSLGMTLRAKSSLPQLVSFLRDFRHAGHLQKIRSLAMLPLGTGAELDVTLAIEVLSLQRADRKDALSDWVLDADDSDPQAVYADLLKRNLFARGLPQALAEIRLQAITVDKQGKSEAWFAAGTPTTTQMVARGESLNLVMHRVVIEEIQPDKVRLSVNQSPHWIALGQRLRDVLEPAEPGAVARPSLPNPPAETPAEKKD